MRPQLARIVEQIKRRRATERGSVDIVLAKAGNPSYAVCVARTVPEDEIAAAVAQQLKGIEQ